MLKDAICDGTCDVMLWCNPHVVLQPVLFSLFGVAPPVIVWHIILSVCTAPSYSQHASYNFHEYTVDLLQMR